MSHNFNFAPPAQASSESWSDDWSTPASASTYEADWSSGPFGNSSETASAFQSESKLGERLRELKDKAVHGMGRKALDAVMIRLPSFTGKDTLGTSLTNAYEDQTYRQSMADSFSDFGTNIGSYQEQAGQYAMNAGREVAGAGLAAAKETVMKYYGLEKDENEKLRVARKLKFGKAVVKTLVNPVGTASSVGVRAGHAARKAAKSEGYSQLQSARSNVMEMSTQYTLNTSARLDSFDDWSTPRAA